ncbi:MAG: radical SAM protein [Bacteroidota bacterium]
MKEAIIKRSVYAAIENRTFRFFLKSVIDREVRRKLFELKKNSFPAFIEKRCQWFSALIEGLCLNLDRGTIRKDVLCKAINLLSGNQLVVDRIERVNRVQEDYKKKYGSYPPLFVTLSPTQVCNLKCAGCYACSDSQSKTTLPYEMVERIVSDLHDNMSNRFITISGGEPLMYKDQGRTLFDLFAHFRDMYFLVYTNGTLLSTKTCEKLAELGNVTPAISVEGWKKQTDERRGKGTFDRVLEGIQNLKAAGIPFGFSSTITTRNVDIFQDEKIYDYFFEQLGATYLWMFHLMPFGRARDTLPLLINSKQRVEVYRLWERLLSEKKYCIADFWNSAAVVDGCVAYGRWNGYFYIDWDGKIMPCVFVPFYEETVYELYKSGRTLGDALQAPLFKNGRAWQKSYGYCNTHKENILMPCSIRDHFKNFKCHILSPGALPENEQAAQMMQDPAVEETLIRFEKDLDRLSRSIWEEEFLQTPAKPRHMDHAWDSILLD